MHNTPEENAAFRAQWDETNARYRAAVAADAADKTDTEETHGIPVPSIESLYQEIMASEVFRTDGKAINLPEALTNLANAIHADESDEIDWHMGEDTEACLSDLLPGAYWALTEWHDGHGLYATLCALGQVFNPGCTSAPTSSDDDPCYGAYELCGKWFETHNTNSKK